MAILGLTKMENRFQVKLKSQLANVASSFSSADRIFLSGLIRALSSDGFEVILGPMAIAYESLGIDVDYVEPGETPDMVWARFFLEFPSGRVFTIIMSRQGMKIALDGS